MSARLPDKSAIPALNLDALQALAARSAFTLVELVISLAVMSVLAVGISSAVVVSLRAVETSNSHSARLRQAADVSNQLAAELGSAVDVGERTPVAVTFSVPDRDNDGSTEQIRYAWSGVAGDPLLRTWNLESAAAILANVHRFSVQYDLVPVPVPATGSDLLLAHHNSSSDLSSLRITSQQWAGQSFRAELPEGATSWKPTRAVVYVRSTGDTGGQVTVQLCSSLSDGRPGSTVYSQTTIAESELRNSYGWTNVSLSCTNYFTPTTRLVLVVRSTINDSCDVRYHNKNVYVSSYSFTSTSSGSSGWWVRSGQGMLFEMYGIVVGGSGDALTEMRLGMVRWELQAGPDVGTCVHGGAQTRNLPE